ncbi:MAG TPA: 3-deoxy-D-manno-octulosonic acid transferase [Geobacteraceae bacterium]
MIYFLYDMALLAAAPVILFLVLSRGWRRGRKREGLGERLGFIAEEKRARLAGRDVIWVHAVSVGETMAVKPLLRALKGRFPRKAIVLSTVTETGQSIAATLADVDVPLYFPFDYGFAVGRAFSQIRPSLVVIMETEIWPNFVRGARQRGIPVVMVNGRISDRSSRRYEKLRWFFGPVLANFAALCMQSTEDARRITAAGAPGDRVMVAGNLKYDLPPVELSREERASLRDGYRLPASVKVFTAGSTHAGEEELVVAAYRELLAQDPESFLVLVPRHPERAAQVGALVESAGLACTYRSRLEEGRGTLAAGGVLLVDTVGELLRFYAVSDLVFVGGSLVPTGGHNLLEPAACGVPVLFGPCMDNFREITALVLSAACGVQVRDGEELASQTAALLADRERSMAMGERGLALIREQSGATDRHLAVLASYLADDPAETIDKSDVNLK